jgi:hypothetical protein
VRSIRLRLTNAQRFVLVVGLGVVAAALGSYITSLGNGFGSQFGWFGYAPLPGNALIGSQGSLTTTQQLLVWLGLVAVWAGVSIWLLHDDYSGYEPEDGGAQDEQ